MTSDRFILPAACVASITMNCPFDQCGWTDSLSALFNPHIRITCMGSGFEISWGESTIADSWEGIVRPFAQMQRARQRSLFVFLVHNSHSGSSGKSGNIGRVVGHQSVSIDFSKPYRSGYKVLLLVWFPLMFLLLDGQQYFISQLKQMDLVRAFIDSFSLLSQASLNRT